jgi:hypothetical protein
VIVVARTSSIREALSPDQIDSIVDRVRRDRALSVATLRIGKLASGAQGQLLAALAKAGLEHTGKAIRLPIRDQLRAIMSGAAAEGLAVTTVQRAVKGARNALEVKLVVRELIEQGELVLIADSRTARLATACDVLSSQELATLASLALQLSGLAKATRAVKGKPRPTLRRSALADARRVLERLTGARAGESMPSEVATTPQSSESVRAALQAAFRIAPTQTGLVRVPDVIRSLEHAYPLGGLLAALEALAREGGLELRPESAVVRLPDAERARCPIGLDGTPLSYARLLEPQGEVRS